MDISYFIDSHESLWKFSGQVEENRTIYDTKNLGILYPIHYDATLTKLGTEMDLECSISYYFSSPCSRCLKETKTLVKHSTHFIVVPSQKEHFFEEEYLEEIIYMEDEQLNIEDVIMSLVIGSVPTKVLCDQECKGLCPQCGKNLNKGLCDCHLETKDQRFDVLKNLFNEHKEV